MASTTSDGVVTKGTSGARYSVSTRKAATQAGEGRHPPALEDQGEGHLDLRHGEGVAQAEARAGPEGEVLVGAGLGGRPALRAELLGPGEQLRQVVGDVRAAQHPVPGAEG